ncbi:MULTISPECIES: NADH:ubiquinone reductase (Na(+)-transporting) subunit D [Imperialibacter]|jgi:Na+-transporting NADH:ubiquinone oxidoreductase subunit D|uniref:Na(+)-translocating NADH-quinone reductase subunit D n=2 Tax=Imperialibacter TaxID=1649461 RepID=A0ABZ0IRI6_9BACT|nr:MULTISPECIES: NADH:ubiquinone reductase (Na(+)-transporting) subunit D [Imperialibacter]WOK07667.1 NADH:ubiquinone reductase (Na(+)-transporting) subunit D [Imperialibacter roseus]CAD5268447.1 Na(+)-translocating NADH-quinone reductase subunit D [Imperialibacter sp. 75]CAD5299821.1 Na(+)-translocating NADH-quinone reductase subunit D [Imperialibacter sp. 89]VVT21710.1 Na(+)-translocating NADH-quinone reductase subunit D [Imperialibacter sp. EC-SDR9]|tara:strand:- start:4339 stop:5001 length:663 start_codon:yes stop_codon:yes gene_type:complete
MSTETLEKPVVKEAEPLFSKRRKKFVTDPLNDDNPVTVQVLGICSALAVTVKMQPTLVMAIAVTLVIVFSNLLISLMRTLIPNRVRIIVQLAVVATLVTLVSEVLKAYAFDMYKVLGAYVGLIITNCIVMGRLEAFALANKPYDSMLDGLGSGLGYSWIILAVAFFRELFGSASIFDFKVFAAMGLDFPTNGLMVDPIGAFMILGLIIWVQRTKNGYVEH